MSPHLHTHRGWPMAGLVFLMAVGCTESPLDEKISNTPAMEIRGKIELDDRASAKGIYVWLERTPLSTYTDDAGEFRLTLPPPSQGQFAVANGVYQLYFYVANYKLTAVTAFLQNGQFLYSYGDFNGSGELVHKVNLQKLLDIETLVEPATVPANFDRHIDVQTTLRAVRDSVTVVFPKMIGGLLGGLLLQNLDTGQIFINVSDFSATTRGVAKIGNEPRSFRQVFNLNQMPLPRGRYEVIPYFLIEQEPMPPNLIASIGPRVEEIGPDFLKIPFKRKGGNLLILE
ncbi:MAG: hypothetical protein ONA90_02705 [candidate division KSB1 bacterium]|nr:hypothetical protein [candidate division KSB1 bacterium]